MSLVMTGRFAARVHRRLGGHLLGVSFFVLAVDGGGPARSDGRVTFAAGGDRHVP